MPYFYFDESIHDEIGFITGCVIYSEIDLNNEIGDAIKLSGLDPNKDEHKSGIRIFGNEKRILLRDSLYEIFRANTRFGLVFISIKERRELLKYGICLIEKIIEKNNLLEDKYSIFFDEGIKNNTKLNDIKNKKLELNLNQDSKIIRGIQIADLISHTCSIMIKEELGLINKSLKAGENSGYEAETLIEIGFFMWSKIRYNFFQSQDGIDDDKAFDGYTNVKDYGLILSDKISEKIMYAIENRFSSNYLGCIH